MSDATQLTEITVYAPADRAREIALAITDTHRVVTSRAASTPGVGHVARPGDSAPEAPRYTVRDGDGVWCGDRQIAKAYIAPGSYLIFTERSCAPNPFRVTDTREARDALRWIAAVLNAEVGRA